MLKQAQASPEINNYFCFLLIDASIAQSTDQKPETVLAGRALAATLLKNDIKTNYKSIPQPTRDYLHANILKGLQDGNAQIRNQTGSVITELIKQGTFMAWPEALQELLALASNAHSTASQQTQEGAMAALLKVCEDNKRALSKKYNDQCPLDILIPRLLDLTGSDRDRIRANAVSAITLFIPDKSDSIARNIDNILQQLFGLASDKSDEVRKFVCRAIVQIASVSPERVAPHLQGLVDYMITQHRNAVDPDLALEAAEFWLFVAEEPSLQQGLGPHLHKILPVLLESMVYDEDDQMRLESEAEDAELEDKESDIKPRFATSKAARGGADATGNSGGKDDSSAQRHARDDGDDDDDDDDLSDGELAEYDDEDGDDDPESIWTLRKCSAAALDNLANVFPKEVFETILPYLKTNLVHDEWPNREAAVLAIGAVADGCMEVVQPHLPDLVPFLVSRLDDPQPIVRQISCWSLGRYSGWAAHLDEAGKEQFFLPMMDGILKRMLDNNKRVQEAAASAFANLEEKAGKALENPVYCEVIVRQFAECFAKYKDRNMFILYDCVQTLAEHVGPTLERPELVRALMPALIKRWEKVPDSSREIFTLQECLSYVATSLGTTFAPYAGPIYQRCVKLIFQTLQDTFAHAKNPALDEPEADFTITSLDLISAIVQSLGEVQSLELVSTTQPSLFEMLNFCLESDSSETKQSAYALLGDCAIYVFPELKKALPQMMPILTSQLDFSQQASDSEEEGYPVANNACWSSGEIAMKAGSAMEPYVETLLQRFYAILVSEIAPQSLKENAAIALGRLGNGCAEILAPHLGTIAPVFFRPMNTIGWTQEKADAMKGMSCVIMRNPQGLEHCLLEYLAEIAGVGTHESTRSWLQNSEPSGCLNAMKEVFTTYKAMIPTFDQYVSGLPVELQAGLTQVMMS